MVFRRVAVLEVVERSRAFRGDRLARIVCRRAHCTATSAAGDVACAGELDGHTGTMNHHGGASQVALPCNAYCVCTLPLHFVLAGAEPAARCLSCNTNASVTLRNYQHDCG